MSHLENLVRDVLATTKSLPDPIIRHVLQCLGVDPEAALNGRASPDPGLLVGASLADDRRVLPEEWVGLRQAVMGDAEPQAWISLCMTVLDGKMGADGRLPASSALPEEMADVSLLSADGRFLSIFGFGFLERTIEIAGIFVEHGCSGFLVMEQEEFRRSLMTHLRPTRGKMPLLPVKRPRPVAPTLLPEMCLTEDIPVTANTWVRMHMSATGATRERAEIALCEALLDDGPDLEGRLSASTVLGGVFREATHQHRNGTLYEMIGYGRDPKLEHEYVVYRDVEKDLIWARPRACFEDGRFTCLVDPEILPKTPDRG